jgi:hypothetical protein
VETSAAADRTNGWQQLSDAIFDSSQIDTAALADAAVSTPKIANGAVTDQKITSMSGSKIISAITLSNTSGADTFSLYHDWEYLTQMRVNTGVTYRARVDADTVSVTEGTTKSAELNVGSLIIADTSLDQTATMNKTSIAFLDDDGTTENNNTVVDTDAVIVRRREIGGIPALLSTRLNAYGITYGGSDDNSTSAFKSYDIRKTGRALSGSAIWTAPDSAGNCYPDITLDAGIPSTAKILGVTASYTDSNASPQQRVVPVSIDYTNTNSISLIFQTGTPGTASAKPASDVVVYIEYDASGIVTTTTP